MIGEEDKERVRQATDFLQLVSETVELRRRGADWWGCCPFHHEKSPSFHVNPTTGLWKCFGCGEGGDVFAYVMKRENLDFPDSVRYLADKTGVELVEERGAHRGPKRNRLIECLTEAAAYYSIMLLRGRGAGPDSARAYLSGRRFGLAVCRKWGIGYAPGRGALVSHLRQKGFGEQEMLAADLAIKRNGHLQDRFFARAMFPICDEQGRVIAFGGRVLDDGKPKYLNTKETPVFHKGKHLFAFDRAKDSIAAQGTAIVCEGYTDVIAMHEAGFTQTVAALGTSFSLDHVRTLARFARRIVCMFDGDAAGQRAAERAIQFLDKSEADLRCVVLPFGLDPAEYLEKFSTDDLRGVLDDAQPLMSFVLAKSLEGISPSSPAGVRASALDSIASKLAPLKDSYVIEEYTLEIAERLGFAAEDVRRAVMEKPVAQDPRYSMADDNDAMKGAIGASAYDAYYDEPPRYDGEFVVSLTNDERMQMQAEQELLSVMAAAPDEVRAHDARIATFVWSDRRHEALAWAMLATPKGSSPAEVVQAAQNVVPEATSILASGRMAYDSSLERSRQVEFLLDTVELYSIKQRIRELRARMRVESANIDELFVEATRLQKQANELQSRLSVNKSGKNG